MTSFQPKIALIVGAGPGLSASLARLFVRSGMQVALAARGLDKLNALANETGASLFRCDAADSASIVQLFDQVEQQLGAPDVLNWLRFRFGYRFKTTSPYQIFHLISHELL
jgi:NAD(P)-dependent dehydrogenase (short-subunit alcohol dehydrogenase family)